MAQRKTPFLTIDKSYLRACRADDLIQYSTDYRFVLPEALVYEVVKDSATSRASLFRKFPRSPDPYTVAVSIPLALAREMEQHKPYCHEGARPRDLSIHDSLANPEYELTESQRSATENVLREVESDMNTVLWLAKDWQVNHADSFSGSDEERSKGRQMLDQEICSEDFVLPKYAHAVSQPWSVHRKPVPVDLLTREWANFRWFQVNALFALDIAVRYPDLEILKKSPNALKKLNHDILDARGLLTALFVDGGFATQEEKLQRFWTLLNPDGLLVSKPNTTPGDS
ncbi:hypothetical protein HHL24_17610 [Paraburkholderia sp. RP-4-7]|jgi:hypothetical protein|uniref:Uncharacterized protein n=1 Tax=Paraburkholderia polaris TaxID=2728848 RepID=A0A848IGB0_9BURK|nr:hypothetical protein [Paraburkholderia polaris]NML99745.1 hypothetical protein [Paraburkholderia polaris]